jgi:hypothetical protein
MAAFAVSPGVIATDMLSLAFGAEASKHQSTEEWVKKVVPFFLKLSVKDNGKSVRIAA